MRAFRLFAGALFAAGLASAGSAAAADALQLELTNGSRIEGRIVQSDEASLLVRLTAGAEMRIAWKDLGTSSWLAAKRSVVDPKDGPALLALAEFAARNSMRGDAETLVAQAVRADGSLAPSAAALAPRLAELRKLEAAVLFERGQALLEKKDWYQALGRFQEAAKLEPSYARAVNGVGEAYFYMRRLKESRRYVDEAIRLDPTCKDALFNRAYLSLLELDFKAFLAGLDEVVALPPDPGRFGTRAEVFAAGKKAGIEKPEEAWKKLADQPLIQAKDLRPIMREIVKGPGFAQDFAATTEHYDLHTNVSQEYADTIAARMELIYAEYDRRYGYEKTGEEKTRGKKLRFPVIVFENRDEYVAWFVRVIGNPALAGATGGVYVDLVKHLVFFKNQSFEDTQLVAWHEGFHQYLDYYVGDVPLWFNEGQAEYYGASRLDKSGKKLLVGQSNMWRIPPLDAMLKGNRLQPAQWLMRCSRGEFMRLVPKKPGETGGPVWTAGDNYAASWALVHFCLEGDRKRWAPSLLTYFKALCDGVPEDAAFQKAFGRVDWNAFNASFHEHCEWLVKRALAEKGGTEVPPMPK
jgi:Flp pilus assembly protein TadD